MRRKNNGNGNGNKGLARQWRCISIEQLEQRILLSAMGTFAPYEVLARNLGYSKQSDGSNYTFAVGSSFDFSVNDAGTLNNYQYTVNHIFSDTSSGFQAFGVISSQTGPAVIFRGTELSKGIPTAIDDILADLDPTGVGTTMVTRNLSSVANWIAQQGQPVDFVGHSLGGALAQWFAAETPAAEIDQVVTFNSPGIPAAEAAKFTGTANNVMHFINSGDLVSLAGAEFIPGEWTLTDKPGSTMLNVLGNHLSPLLYTQQGSAYTAVTSGSFDRYVTHTTDDDLNSAGFNYFQDWEYDLSATFLTLEVPEAGLLTTRVGVESLRASVGFIAQLLGNNIASLNNQFQSIVNQGWSAIQSTVQNFQQILLPLTGNLDMIGTANIDLIAPDNVVVSFTHQNNNDVMLVIDQSGSMGDSIDGTSADTKMDDAIIAASSFVNLMNIHDKIGVVSFSDYATLQMPLTDISGTDVLTQATDAIDALYPTDSTSIGAGLQSADTQLDGFPTDFSRSMILLTDGLENTEPWAQDIVNSDIDSNIRIYTIAFGSDADTDLLQSLASERNGQYYYAASLPDLQSIYLDISARNSGDIQNLMQQSTIQLGQTIDYPLDVSDNTLQQLFRIDWPGSDMDMALVDPSGNTWDSSNISSNPNMRLVKEGTYELIQVTTPQAGSWHMMVTGVSVASGGEQVTATGLSQPMPALAGTLPSSVTFTAKKPLPAFKDTNGESVKITLAGAGTAMLTYTQDDQGLRTMKSLSIIGSDATTNLSFKVTPPKGTAAQNTTLESLNIDGNAKAVSAGSVNVLNQVSIGGVIPTLTLGNCSQAQISIAGNLPAGTTIRKSSTAIKLGAVTDTSLNTNNLPIKSLSVINWLANNGNAGVITAPSIGSLTSIGQKASRHVAAISGEFDAGLSVAGSLGTISINGPVVGGIWNVTGDVNSVIVSGELAATVHGRTFKTISAGSMTGATITQTASASSLGKTKGIGTLQVAATMHNSNILASGAIGTASFGAMLDSSLFSAVASGLSGLPNDSSQLAAGGSIGSVTIIGIKGISIAFAGSVIAAHDLGQITIRQVNTDNSGTSLGLACVNLKKYSRIEPGKKTFVWTAKNPPANLLADNDLVETLL